MYRAGIKARPVGAVVLLEGNSLSRGGKAGHCRPTCSRALGSECMPTGPRQRGVSPGTEAWEDVDGLNSAAFGWLHQPASLPGNPRIQPKKGLGNC